MILRNLFTFGLVVLFQLVCSAHENSVDELSAGDSFDRQLNHALFTHF